MGDRFYTAQLKYAPTTTQNNKERIISDIEAVLDIKDSLVGLKILSLYALEKLRASIIRKYATI